jgi:diacylglycerol O-acyltransferase / wax synthase
VRRRKLNPVDTIWLNTDHAENRTVIEALLLVEGALDRARFEQVLRTRLVDRFPVFRERIVPGRFPGSRPSWGEIPGFRVADHVVAATLPSPGDDSALQRYVAGFLSAPLGGHRPLWEIHVIDGYGSGTAVFVRLHHSLADGVALTQVLLSITDGEIADGAITDVQEPPPEQPADDAVRSLPTASRAAVPVLRHLVGIPATAARLLVARNPRTAMSRTATAVKLVVWSGPIPLERIKAVARATGTTLNDVLVAALAGAVRRYQVHRGDRPVDVNTAVPVNLRSLGQPLPARLGNRFALVLLTLPSGLSTATERLAESKRRMDRIKDSPEALIVAAVMQVIGLGGPWLSRLMVKFFATKADSVTTNVPGPRQERYLAGARVGGILGWVPCASHQTLGTCIFTYAGAVRVGFKTDAAAIPDPDWILTAFIAELDALFEFGEPSSG